VALKYKFKEDSMSVDLESIASEFKCSVDDVKGMLVGIVSELNNIVEIIEISINSDDFESIVMASGMINTHIGHFQLNDIEASTKSLINSANAKDISSCQSNFTSLKAGITQLETLVV
jgi:hypothetical protein